MGKTELKAVRLPEGLVKAVKERADAQNRNFSNMLVELLWDGLEAGVVGKPKVNVAPLASPVVGSSLTAGGGGTVILDAVTPEKKRKPGKVTAEVLERPAKIAKPVKVGTVSKAELRVGVKCPHGFMNWMQCEKCKG